MADPRISGVGPQARSANLSPLMTALGKASLGEKVNFCPYGCTTDDLDENNYCRHLIGFTYDTPDKVKAGEGKMERLAPIDADGRRRVQVSKVNKDGKEISILDPIPKDAKLERITSCYRVYHESGCEAFVNPAPEGPPKPATETGKSKKSV